MQRLGMRHELSAFGRGGWRGDRHLAAELVQELSPTRFKAGGTDGPTLGFRFARELLRPTTQLARLILRSRKIAAARRNKSPLEDRVRSSNLGDARSLHRSQINLEQGLVLLALFLVLLSQPNDLSNDLNVEAVALGFLKDFPLSFV